MNITETFANFEYLIKTKRMLSDLETNANQLNKMNKVLHII